MSENVRWVVMVALGQGLVTTLVLEAPAPILPLHLPEGASHFESDWHLRAWG